MAAAHDDHQPEEIHSYVRERYARAARGSATTSEGRQASEIDPASPAGLDRCCGSSAGSSAGDGCCAPSAEPVALAAVEKLYQAPDAKELPEAVTSLSLGCGDPVTLASLQPGQIVLDLGSGGGIDCFLAAKRVGASGHVIGVDMTPEMLDRARQNKAQLGADNVEFRLGEIEHLPVPDSSVDVVISNCVINLSPDKPQVFREAFRVLRPGGRLAVSDIVTDGPLPESVKRNLSAWAGCVAGAWDASDYTAAIAAAGFGEVSLTPVHFSAEFISEGAKQLAKDIELTVTNDELAASVYSARVTATKPLR
jgi:ubiquinone/menaquinone biosynthesis C-methylase UbiE